MKADEVDPDLHQHANIARSLAALPLMFDQVYALLDPSFHLRFLAAQI